MPKHSTQTLSLQDAGHCHSTQGTTPAPPLGPVRPGGGLLATLCALLVHFRTVCRQERVFVRMVALLFAKLATVGRQTVTQHLLALGQQEADWSAAYRLFSRQRIDEALMAQQMLHETLVHAPPAEPYVVGLDATHLPRTSLKMPGCGWMRSPGTAFFQRGLQPGQRFGHCAFLTPIEQGYSRAIPLRFVPAPPASAARPAAAADGPPLCSEWQAGQSALAWVRQGLDAAGRSDQLLLGVGDGNYDTLELWRQLPERTLLLVRTAKNRALVELPAPPSGRGRPCKYGGRAPAPQAWLQVESGWRQCTVTVRGRRLRHRYRVEGPFLRKGAAQRPLFLLVVRGEHYQTGKQSPKEHKRKPAFYLVSAVEREGGWQLPLPAETLLAWLWQRWELEVAHREMKSGLGVGETQCFSRHGAILSVQWCVWVYALLVLVGYRCWGMTGGPPPVGKWQRRRQRRWSLNTLWRSYRSELWRQTHFVPLSRPSATNWPEIEQCVQMLLNGMLQSGVT